MAPTKSNKTDRSSPRIDSRKSSKSGSKRHVSISNKGEKKKGNFWKDVKLKKPATKRKPAAPGDHFAQLLASISDMYDRDIENEQYAQQLFFNCKLIEHGLSIYEINFIYGEKPKDLPSIKKIEDIDNLSKEECITYLRGYGISFKDEETIGIKRKLATAVGFKRPVDLEFQWSLF